MKKSSSTKLTRRNFVATGSAVVATVGFGGIGRAALADCTGIDRQKTAGLSVAYLQGSEDWDYLHGLTPTLARTTDDMAVDETVLITADAMESGDFGFAARGARVKIHGMISERADRLPPMLLRTHYRPYHEETHVAWGIDNSADGCAQPGTTFAVPVDASAGLQLSLEMPRSGKSLAADPAIAEARFVLGAMPGEAKLRRGAYLMTWGLPDAPIASGWNGYRVIAERIETPEEGMPETRRFMVTDASGVAKALPALLLTVDYRDGVPA